MVLDDALIEEARRLTGLQAKREIVEEALRTLVRVREQQQALALFGKLPWDGDLAEIRRGRNLTVGE
ncbi:type II toxin-antitoxin system VapB family antitoxin [bacterium]|nr:type II toxin-antitoxin system VapB family antitoxin [bacterium]